MIILDIETTGLDPSKHHILEVAALRVDNELNVLEEFQRVLALPRTRLSDVAPVVLRMHIDNGLLLECADRGIHISDADYALMQFFERDGDKPYLAGDSIHFDRKFLDAHMHWCPKRLHYRMVDTSSFMVAFDAWGVLSAPRPVEPAHRALADCYVSLEKLRFYRNQARAGL